MKKLVSTALALALCLSLSVPAFAANYESYTATHDIASLTFDAASVTKETIKLQGMEGDPYEKQVTMIAVKPGSTVTVRDELNDNIVWMFGYELLSDGVYDMSPVSYVITTGPVDSVFEGQDGVNYNLILPLGNDTYVRLSDDAGQSGSSTPTEQPVTPTEQPVTPTEQPVTPTEQPVTPTEQPAASQDTYAVKKGDTMGQIALNFYGSYGHHKALYHANSAAFAKTGGKLVPGMVLTLPEKLGKVVRLNAPAAAEGETLYTVKSGDTLGKIAKAAYGNSSKYKAIFERNSDRLKNANTIYEGQVIVLPAK